MLLFIFLAGIVWYVLYLLYLVDVTLIITQCLLILSCYAVFFFCMFYRTKILQLIKHLYNIFLSTNCRTVERHVTFSLIYVDIPDKYITIVTFAQV